MCADRWNHNKIYVQVSAKCISVIDGIQAILERFSRGGSNNSNR